ncbi:MAG TPA: very short patch repair endonuclease [Caulobacteraceae bacterium]|nr:very short patch repair endonuclease [Caulobacteraceae bacterium]
MDTLTPAQRSERMRRVRQAGTEPELIVRRALRALGYRYRLHRRDLPGSPDIVLPSRRKVIFVHGCFWHAHAGCRRATTPKSNADYWVAKLAENRERDARARAALEAAGWTVGVVWECETSDPRRMTGRLDEFFLCSRSMA